MKHLPWILIPCGIAGLLWMQKSSTNQAPASSGTGAVADAHKLGTAAQEVSKTAQPDAWKLVSVADGDGAWLLITGFPFEDGDGGKYEEAGVACHWTIAVGEHRFSVKDDSPIPEEGLCPLQTAKRLPRLEFPPKEPLIASVELRGAQGQVIGTAGPTSFRWNAAELVSTRALEKAWEAQGWHFRPADLNSEWAEDYLWYAGTLERGDFACETTIQIGRRTTRKPPYVIESAHVVKGVNHEITLACGRAPTKEDVNAARALLLKTQSELLALLKTQLRGVIAGP